MSQNIIFWIKIYSLSNERPTVDWIFMGVLALQSIQSHSKVNARRVINWPQKFHYALFQVQMGARVGNADSNLHGTKRGKVQVILR